MGTQVGNRFGKLVAVELVRKNNHTHYLCKCDCGGSKTVRSDALASLITTDCGCERHGYCRDGKVRGEYWSWWNAKKRCTDQKNSNYHRYGARGISMDPEWMRSFKAFIDHIGPKPTPQHTLDRINNDLGYFSGNVRWATKSEQAYNRDNKSLWETARKNKALRKLG